MECKYTTGVQKRKVRKLWKSQEKKGQVDFIVKFSYDKKWDRLWKQSSDARELPFEAAANEDSAAADEQEVSEH